MRQTYFLDVRDKPGLPVALTRRFAGGAHLALEGNRNDMSEMNFDGIQGVKEGIVEPFEHEYDKDARFVVFPLETETIPGILRQILHQVRVVHKIGAIQIEKFGEIQFLAGDNFHRECVSVGPGVPEQLLKDLQASGVLRAYYSAEMGAGNILRKLRARS